MFKEMAALANLMKNANQIVGQAGEMKARLAAMRIEGHSQGVAVVATGDHKIVSVRISEEAHISLDRGSLEAALLAASAEALAKAREAVAQEMNGVASDLGMGGLSDAMAKFGLGR